MYLRKSVEDEEVDRSTKTDEASDGEPCKETRETLECNEVPPDNLKSCGEATPIPTLRRSDRSNRGQNPKLDGYVVCL